jgi:predicted TIM-barrel fold metal-dependent hydrolase
MTPHVAIETASFSGAPLTSDRRTFLRAGVATLAAAVLARAESEAPAIIDCHTHFYDTTRPQGVPWPSRNDALLYKPSLPAHLRKVTEGLGVTGTVVVEASAWLEDNQWLLDLAKDDPFILGIIGHLNPGEAGFADHLKRFAANPLFRGIRIGNDLLTARRNEPQFIADLKRLADAGLTLDINCQLPMLAEMARIAADIPELRIVVNHMPPGTAVLAASRELYLDVLGKCTALPRVFIKISEVARRNAAGVITDAEFYRPEFEELWKRFGPKRLVYGSNWPVMEKVAPYGTGLRIVRDYFTTKGAEASTAYFHANSRTAYGWAPRSPR